MAIPSAVLARKEKLQGEIDAAAAALKAANGEGGEAANDSALKLVGEYPAVLAQPQLKEIKNELRSAPPGSVTQAQLDAALAQIKDLEVKYGSTHGRMVTNASEVKEKEEQLKIAEQNRLFLEKRLGELTDELAAVESNKRKETLNKSLSMLDGDDLNDEELEAFDTNNIRIIKGLSKREMKNLKPVFEAYDARIAQLEASLGNVAPERLQKVERTLAESSATRAADAERQFYIDALKNTPHKDFETFVKTPAWGEFIKRDVEGMPGTNYSQFINSYRSTRNLAGLISVFDLFKQSLGTKVTLADFAQPNASNAQREQSQEQPKPKFKQSDYTVNLTKFTKRLMSKTDWEAYKADFAEASKDGRVTPN